MFKFFKKISEKVKDSASKIFHIVFPEKIDEQSVKIVENALYSADFGVEITSQIIDEIKSSLRQNKELRRENIVNIASKVLKDVLTGSEGAIDFSKNQLEVICLVGVNGSGKTTTTAKLAYFYKNCGKSVLLGSCDTFRAAANEQLSTWAERLSIDIISSCHGSDPAAVAFDSHKAAIARKKDILILDTAGRLHVKTNLMSELQKIFRVLKKSDENLIPHIWLVTDSTIGMNTISSAKAFHDSLGLTGLIMTKLDGTSGGGALVGMYKKLHIPIYFVGSGEQVEDLEVFSCKKYISRIFV